MFPIILVFIQISSPETNRLRCNTFNNILNIIYKCCFSNTYTSNNINLISLMFVRLMIFLFKVSINIIELLNKFISNIFFTLSFSLLNSFHQSFCVFIKINIIIKIRFKFNSFFHKLI